MRCVGGSWNFHDCFESRFNQGSDHCVAILYHDQGVTTYNTKKQHLTTRKYECLRRNELCSLLNWYRVSVIYICVTDIYLINYLLKMDFHSTALHILMLIRAVNQHWELFWSDFLSSVSKHKEHWIYHIGLPTPIWTNDAGKALRERWGREKNRPINYIKIYCSHK